MPWAVSLSREQREDMERYSIMVIGLIDRGPRWGQRLLGSEAARVRI